MELRLQGGRHNVENDSAVTRGTASLMPYRNLAGLRARYARIGGTFFGETAPGRNEALSVEVPNSWERSVFGEWTVLFPPRAVPLPDQGWKIHISARPSDLLDALQLSSEFCVEYGLPFKHLASMENYRDSMLKYADRGSAGKLITIYPPNNETFEFALPRLEELLSGLRGPYILSDTKFGKSPVFFRYGGFTAIPLDPSGQKWAIRDPEGTLVPDERQAIFALPEFADIPESIKPLVDGRLSASVDDASEVLHPYAVTDGLHFSNAGGVYRGRNVDTGAQIVLKEARKWAGYSAEGVDATSRLQNECQALSALKTINAIPNVLDYLALDEHEFLVEEYREGETLQDWVATNYPLDLQREQLVAYEKKAVVLAEQIVSTVHQIHDLGWTLRDIQPNNVLVNKTLRFP